MVSVSAIILEYVCPALGTIMANLMFAAPLQDLNDAVAAGTGIGSLNPTPWAFMLGNCLGWTTYGILKQNLFIFLANAPGFLIAVWLNLGAVKLLYQSHHSTQWRESVAGYLSSSSRQRDEEELMVQLASTVAAAEEEDQEEHEEDQHDQEEQGTIGRSLSLTNCNCAANANATAADSAPAQAPPPLQDWAKIVWQVTSQTTPAPAPHERLVLGVVFVWTCVASVVGLMAGGNNSNSLSLSSAEMVVGYVVNLNLVFFYGAPLSTIYTVLQQKTSISIHIPTLITNTLNATFWTAYGVTAAINDPFIYVPNGVGAVLGLVQIFLLLLFPRRQRREEQEETPTTATAALTAAGEGNGHCDNDGGAADDENHDGDNDIELQRRKHQQQQQQQHDPPNDRLQVMAPSSSSSLQRQPSSSSSRDDTSSLPPPSPGNERDLDGDGGPKGDNDDGGGPDRCTSSSSSSSSSSTTTTPTAGAGSHIDTT